MSINFKFPCTSGARPELPALIAAAGERAARFLEFFTVNIRNGNTRAAYARAAGAFLRWWHQCLRLNPMFAASFSHLGGNTLMRSPFYAEQAAARQTPLRLLSRLPPERS